MQNWQMILMLQVIIIQRNMLLMSIIKEMTSDSSVEKTVESLKANETLYKMIYSTS